MMIVNGVDGSAEMPNNCLDPKLPNRPLSCSLVEDALLIFFACQIFVKFLVKPS